MVCYVSTVVYRHDLESINVCTDLEHLDTIVVDYSPEMYRELVEFFEKRYSGFADLIKLIISNDLINHFIGTHNSMNRTVFRLCKLRYIISQKDVVKYSPLGFNKLFTAILEDYDRAINALLFFKGDHHRVRDKVHELMYPIIRGILERFLTVRVYYRMYSRRFSNVYIKCVFRYQMYREMESDCWLVRDDDIVKKLSTREIYEILSKQIQRRDKRIEEKRLDELIWEFLNGEWHHDPMDDILELIDIVLGGGM